MIGQYLSNTNEIDTIHILQNILQLNKALIEQLWLLGKAIISGPHVSSDPICQTQCVEVTMDVVKTETVLAATEAAVAYQYSFPNGRHGTTRH